MARLRGDHRDPDRPTGSGRARVDLRRYEELFNDPALTFAAIGRLLGCTGENVRTVYQRHFSEQFPERNGQERRRRGTLDRMASRKEGLFPAQLEAWMLAEEAGLSVRRSVTEGRHIGPGPFLLIEGRICDASLSTRKVTPDPKSRAAYTYHDLRRASKCDFVVIIQKVPLHPRRVFTVPSHELLRHRSTRFYVPLFELPPYRKTSRVNWKEYENAWQLLSGTSDQPKRGRKAAKQ